MAATEAYLAWKRGEFSIGDPRDQEMTEHEYMMATSGHDFRQAPLTGTVTCTICGLLPLDDDDLETECDP